jgi:hypothetical protein
MSSCSYTSVIIKKSTKPDKKLQATFDNKKTIHFGAAGMSDYTISKDKQQRDRYIARHKAREDWTRCDTAGSLSYHILWSEPTRTEAIRKYKSKFHLQ